MFTVITVAAGTRDGGRVEGGGRVCGKPLTLNMAVSPKATSELMVTLKLVLLPCRTKRLWGVAVIAKVAAADLDLRGNRRHACAIQQEQHVIARGRDVASRGPGHGQLPGTSGK